MRRARERCELQGPQRTWLPRTVTDVPFGMALEGLTAADQPYKGRRVSNLGVEGRS